MNNKFIPKKSSVKYTFILPASLQEIRFSRMNYKMTKDLNTAIAYESVNTFYNALIETAIDVVEGMDKETILDMFRVDFEALMLEIHMRSSGSTKNRALECGKCKTDTEFQIHLDDATPVNLDKVSDREIIKLDDDSHVILKQQTVRSYLNSLKMLDDIFGEYSFNTEFTEDDNDLILDIGDEKIKLDKEAFKLGNYIEEICLSLNENLIFTPSDIKGDNFISLRDMENFIYSQDDIESDLFKSLDKFTKDHPLLELPIKAECKKCGNVHEEKIYGLQNFFES